MHQRGRNTTKAKAGKRFKWRERVGGIIYARKYPRSDFACLPFVISPSVEDKVRKYSYFFSFLFPNLKQPPSSQHLSVCSFEGNKRGWLRGVYRRTVVKDLKLCSVQAVNIFLAIRMVLLDELQWFQSASIGLMTGLPLYMQGMAICVYVSVNGSLRNHKHNEQ